MLKIHNSLAREKQEFVPIEPGKVRMYVCGVTVYDYCHLGHARFLIAFDIVRRWLEAVGYQVTYVRNITDIEDKIIKPAQENGEPVESLTARFIQAMNEDIAALNCEPADFEPRATEHVPGMLEMIAQLEARGLAYAAASGDVNYAVRKFPGYGKLSGRTLDELRAGERVEVDIAKQDPLDFVLWKKGKPGEPSWDSPWGPGRPGWHIECSVMSSSLLGNHFDIHGGGHDLQFPHHENEIAQSEGAHGGAFVNYWMHNGFIRVQKGETSEKMSKSLGNFFTIREVLGFLTEKYAGDREKAAEVIRFFIVRTQYRSPITYSEQHLDDAGQALTRLYTALKGGDGGAGAVDWDEPHAKRFRDAMNDDFNTSGAVAELFNLANELNRSHDARVARLLKSLGGVLGLLQRDPQAFLQGRSAAITPGTGAMALQGHTPELIEKLIAERAAARKAKNFAESDRIRKELLDSGIVLEDTTQGTTWRRS
jgi:cysteinyl-tRNA synthetase